MTEPKRWTACDQLREAVAALPQYVITIQDREGYTYERGCAGQPMNYTGVMLADVEALVGRELKYDAPVARETTDELKDAHRPWPIAPDTVMPPRRQPIRWGSRADDPPTEIHDDPQRTKAYLAGLAAGRTEAAAASPDERLREANGYEQRIAALDDLVQRAWSLIAAAMSGSPRQFSDEWKDSAERWEVDYCMGQGASGLRSRSSVGGGGVVSAVDADAPHQREPGEAPDTPGTCRAPHCWSEYGTPCANCPEEKR